MINSVAASPHHVVIWTAPAASPVENSVFQMYIFQFISTGKDVTVRSYRFFIFFFRCRNRKSVTATGSEYCGSLYTCTYINYAQKYGFMVFVKKSFQRGKSLSFEFRSISKSLRPYYATHFCFPQLTRIFIY